MCRTRVLWLCLFLATLSTVAAGAEGPSAREPAAGKQAARKTTARKPVVKQEEARGTANAEPAAKEKELSGMSIVGNDEAPKSLYIVPWKSSEMGMETSLNMMLDDSAVPVDRDVFKRQLEFFEISSKK